MSTLTEKYQHIIEYFSAHNPNAASELSFTNAFELTVAVVLSAQCTDKRVNMVTPALFKAYPTPQAMAEASVEQLYQKIQSVSYPHNKAKHLKGLAEILVQYYHGEIPHTLTELQTLPGVGRKTANVVLAVIFNQPTMAVDTHVFRVSARIGLVRHAKRPFETEKQLMANFPKEIIPLAHHWLILHGRYVCLARQPKCEECGIKDYCDTYQAQLTQK